MGKPSSYIKRKLRVIPFDVRSSAFKSPSTVPLQLCVSCKSTLQTSRNWKGERAKRGKQIYIHKGTYNDIRVYIYKEDCTSACCIMIHFLSPCADLWMGVSLSLSLSCPAPFMPFKGNAAQTSCLCTSNM